MGGPEGPGTQALEAPGEADVGDSWWGQLPGEASLLLDHLSSLPQRPEGRGGTVLGLGSWTGMGEEAEKPFPKPWAWVVLFPRVEGLLCPEVYLSTGLGEGFLEEVVTKVRPT